MRVTKNVSANAPRVAGTKTATKAKPEAAAAATAAGEAPPPPAPARQAGRGKAAPSSKDTILLRPLQRRLLTLHIRGTTPLIVHAWDEKAKGMMRAKQQGHASATDPKAPKDPRALIEGCKYLDVKKRDCVPAVSFKNAIVAAARFTEGLPMTFLRGALFVRGDTRDANGVDLLTLSYSSITSREDMVRVGQGTADMRYRPQYNDWSVDLPIEFDESVVSADIVANLVRRAGFSVGIGEWRPECDGTNGQFDIADSPAAAKGSGRKAGRT